MIAFWRPLILKIKPWNSTKKLSWAKMYLFAPIKWTQLFWAEKTNKLKYLKFKTKSKPKNLRKALQQLNFSRLLKRSALMEPNMWLRHLRMNIFLFTILNLKKRLIANQVMKAVPPRMPKLMFPGNFWQVPELMGSWTSTSWPMTAQNF